MSLSIEAMEEAYNQLNQNARPLLGAFTATIAAIPAAFIVVELAKKEPYWVVFFITIIPTTMIGFSARYFGQCYQFKHRVWAGICAAFIHIFSINDLKFGSFNSEPYTVAYFLMFPLTFMVTTYIAKVSTTPIEKAAIARGEVGMLNLNKDSK